MKLRRRLGLRFKLRAALRLVGRAAEILRYATRRPDESLSFHIVSCERHAGDAAIKCLESVYHQSHDRRRVRHVFIDDDSADDTHALVTEWLREHPDHNVDYRHNTERIGGARNTLDGFADARPGSIVIELNGDDWLPDPNVLRFLSKLYSDPDIWMTYNTLRRSDGHISHSRPYSRAVERANAFRDAPWASALHSFRMELLAHFDETWMIDPQTNDYWSNADDQAFYFPLLEMSGPRARHVYRITYIYNVRDESEFALDGTAQAERSRRIRQLPRQDRLASLDAPPARRDPSRQHEDDSPVAKRRRNSS